MMITPKSEVLLHMKIMLKDKTLAQDTRDNQPLKLFLGTGDLTDNFESNLIGLKVGDKKAFMLESADSFGDPNPDNIHDFLRSDFPPNEKLETGTIFMFNQPNGAELPGLIREIEDKRVIVDFNHPLAGLTLIFEVEILEVSEKL
jgi:FKBP-type peptidyl-prolyl cis-trans isomerase SlpA